MTITLSAHGLLEIPEVFRKADDLKPGQRCDIERVGEGDYRLRMEKEPDAMAPDLVAWLLACPVKDWWVEHGRSERTALKPSTLFDE
ncbi:MAG: hypothetical protein ABL974_07665 [Prosthecobacter sp.]